MKERKDERKKESRRFLQWKTIGFLFIIKISGIREVLLKQDPNTLKVKKDAKKQIWNKIDF